MFFGPETLSSSPGGACPLVFPFHARDALFSYPATIADTFLEVKRARWVLKTWLGWFSAVVVGKGQLQVVSVDGDRDDK